MLQQDFKLVHYAGEVTYTVQGFMEKNNDLLFRDLRLVMSETTNSITKVCLYFFRFFKESLLLLSNQDSKHGTHKLMYCCVTQYYCTTILKCGQQIESMNTRDHRDQLYLQDSGLHLIYLRQIYLFLSEYNLSLCGTGLF